jgi:uncharacterized protein (DUF952 family)
MALIYHITAKADWEAAKKKGLYMAPSLETEGFIHCSEEQQVKAVLERYYSGKKDLLKLVIDPKKLKPELKYELAPSVHESFPHVYGPINLDAVIEVQMIYP